MRGMFKGGGKGGGEDALCMRVRDAVGVWGV